jgi:hypothetical protein
MKDEALKLALDDLILEYHMETSSFAKRVNEIFKQALAAPVQPVPWSQALESVWAEPDDTPPAQPAPVQEPAGWRPATHHRENLTFNPGLPDEQTVKFWKLQGVEIEYCYTTPPAQPAPVQEPVVFFRCNGCGHAYEQVHPTSCDCMEAGGFDRVEYFTTPPAPAVPDAITDDSESPEYRTGWNDCRAEMLKGMKP